MHGSCRLGTPLLNNNSGVNGKNLPAVGQTGEKIFRLLLDRLKIILAEIATTSPESHISESFFKCHT